MKTAYEYIVVGCGGIGSAAAYWLARRAGAEVLALEQFALGHDNGGSQDHSRIIRLAYHEAEYARIAPHMYTAWHVVEAEAGMQLVFKVGGLNIEPPGAQGAGAVKNYVAAMRAADIPHEELNADETMARWPQFRLDDGTIAVYQRDGGFVDARKANAVHVSLARAHGATILDNTTVRAITPLADGVKVYTDAGAFHCKRLVLTTASWTNNLLRHVGMEWPITVTQEQVTYFQTPNLRDFAPDRFPVWIWHAAGKDLYGVPVYGEVAVKGGQDVGGDIVTTETRTFTPNPRPFNALHQFFEKHLPDALGPVLYTKTCLYDIPPDRNFVIDHLPGLPQIAIGLGAGHGFKFACLIGKILSELAMDNRTNYPIHPFRTDRPALTDPSYPRAFQMNG